MELERFGDAGFPASYGLIDQDLQHGQERDLGFSEEKILEEDRHGNERDDFAVVRWSDFKAHGRLFGHGVIGCAVLGDAHAEPAGGDEQTESDAEIALGGARSLDDG